MRSKAPQQTNDLNLPLEIKEIKKRLWNLENPPKYKIGDKVVLLEGIPAGDKEVGVVVDFEKIPAKEYEDHFEFPYWEYEVIFQCDDIPKKRLLNESQMD